MNLVIGGRYNWKNQPEKLVYLGLGSGGSMGWHQFALIEKPEVVWCEVLEKDLRMLEETKTLLVCTCASLDYATDKESMPVCPHCKGLKLKLLKEAWLATRIPPTQYIKTSSAAKPSSEPGTST